MGDCVCERENEREEIERETDGGKKCERVHMIKNRHRGTGS